IEPNSLPSSPALELMVKDAPSRASARAWAAASFSAAAFSSSARRSSNAFTFASVAGTALPYGSRKLRPKPALTFTLSPREPRFATFSSRITSISLTSSCFIQPDRRVYAPGYPASYPQKPEPLTASTDWDPAEPEQRKTLPASFRSTAFEQTHRAPEPARPEPAGYPQPRPAGWHSAQESGQPPW